VTTILLARHGETDWNRDGRFQGHADPPLNETGRTQAESLADTLGDDPPDAVYSSDLRRAVETAEIVGKRLDLPVGREIGLREIHVGSWQGLTREEIDGREWDGETYEQHRERVLAVLRKIGQRHPHARILVVAHGGCLRRIQEEVLGEGLPVIEHCGVWSVVIEDGDLRPSNRRSG
jgi:2,3-bisphosphoglycerate-dependent phosphoglycerate mutase